MLIALVILLVCLLLFSTVYLTGPELSMYDNLTGDWFDSHEDDKEANQRFYANIAKIKQASTGLSIKQSLDTMRDFADKLSDGLEKSTLFTTVEANGVPCEWAIPENCDDSIRTIMFHGGAFLFGSPKGHRVLADQIAKTTKGPVLSVDYRLMPENGRFKSILDAQTAFNWVISNGPNGSTEAQKLLVAGDSAGGNLALMLSAWSKKHATRSPDAVLAISPCVDMTLASPTIKQNLKTDKMLGESLGKLAKLPMSIRMLVSTLLMRCNPSNPLVSPLFQDLSSLPPTLIHASSNEMLLGDAIRYTNKALVSGSDVRLQVWKDQVHDWHVFNIGYGSANKAWSEIEKFLTTLLKN